MLRMFPARRVSTTLLEAVDGACLSKGFCGVSQSFSKACCSNANLIPCRQIKIDKSDLLNAKFETDTKLKSRNQAMRT